MSDKCTLTPPCNSSSVALESDGVWALQSRVSGPDGSLKGPCVPSLGLLIFTPLILESLASTVAFQDASSPVEFMAAAHASGRLLSSLLILSIHPASV